MPHVQVTIAGRAYRMACGEGEEAHLTALAEHFDGKIGEMRAAFGEIGDMRLHVMAALTLADDAAEGARQRAALQAELDVLRARLDGEVDRAAEGARAMAAALDTFADRTERLTAIVASRLPSPER